jgi:hypothetical protein
MTFPSAAWGPVRSLGARQTGKFPHQKPIGQAMEAPTTEIPGLVAARDGKQLGHAGHAAVESRVEARHLGKPRETPT